VQTYFLLDTGKKMPITYRQTFYRKTSKA